MSKFLYDQVDEDLPVAIKEQMENLYERLKPRQTV